MKNPTNPAGPDYCIFPNKKNDGGKLYWKSGPPTIKMLNGTFSLTVSTNEALTSPYLYYVKTFGAGAAGKAKSRGLVNFAYPNG